MSRIYTDPNTGLQVYKDDGLMVVQHPTSDNYWTVNSSGVIFNKALRPVSRNGRIGQRVLAAIAARAQVVTDA